MQTIGWSNKKKKICSELKQTILKNSRKKYNLQSEKESNSIMENVIPSFTGRY